MEQTDVFCVGLKLLGSLAAAADVAQRFRPFHLVRASGKVFLSKLYGRLEAHSQNHLGTRGAAVNVPLLRASYAARR